MEVKKIKVGDNRISFTTEKGENLISKWFKEELVVYGKEDKKVLLKIAEDLKKLGFYDNKRRLTKEELLKIYKYFTVVFTTVVTLYHLL